MKVHENVRVSERKRMRTHAAVVMVVLAVLSLFGVSTVFSQEIDNPKPVTAGVEMFLMSWPDEEGWTVANDQDNAKMHLVEVVRKGETLENWSQLGTMMAFKNTHVPDISVVSKGLKDSHKSHCSDVHLIVHTVEQDREYPRSIFSLECSKESDGTAESGVWMATQGKSSLYLIFRSIKAGSVPEKLRTEWIEWLKTGKVVIK